MATPTKCPKTVEELQVILRLKSKRDVEALIKADPIKEAFRMYMNRCFSAGSITQSLPDWKDIDEYLIEKQMSPKVRSGKTLREVVAEDCYGKPYELIPHVSMFALRVMSFIKSENGNAYDMSLEGHAITRVEDVFFDRCIRIMNLLGFLVNQNQEMKRIREEKKEEYMMKNNWI